MSLSVAGSRPFSLDTSSKTPHRRADVGSLFILGLFLLVAGITRASMLARPFYHDGGLYIYMGKTVATGGVLYQDFYENKPPGVGLLMSIVWRALGSNWLAYCTLQFGLALASAWMLARTAGRVFGSHAWKPTLIFGIVCLNFNWLVYSGFQLETVQAFFASLAACAAMEAIASDDLRDTALAGLAGGVASMIKPTGLAVCGAMMLGMLLRWREIGAGRVIRHAIVLTICAAIPNLGVALWVIKSGLAPMMPHLLHEIALYGKETPLEWMDWWKLGQVILFFGFPLLVRGVIFRRGEKGATAKPTAALVTFALSWFLIEGLGVFLQKRMYSYHFMVVIPPATVIYGMLARRDRWIPIAAGLVPISMFSMWWSLYRVLKLPEGYEISPISQYIVQHSGPMDRIYTDEYPRIIMETGLDYGARYGTLFYFVNHDDAPKEYGDQLIADLEHRQPKYIVLAQNREEVKQHELTLTMLRLRPRRLAGFLATWNEYENYVKVNYDPIMVANEAILYVRKADAGTAVAGARATQLQTARTE
jgi:hypothetical protein